MKKFKDFIYDKNDIIIALLILVIAALIIFWRLNVILEYPKQLIGNGDNDVVTGTDNPDGDSSGDADKTDDKDKDKDKDDDKDKPDDTDNPDDTDKPDDGGAAANLPLWEGGVLTKDVEVDVEGNSASAAIQCLIDKDLFDDYADYQAICEASGLDHEKVKAGTFTFKKGSTKKDIAKMMNWG